MSPIDFTPIPPSQTRSISTTPASQTGSIGVNPQKYSEIGTPRWIADQWRELYYQFPTEGLAKRVKEADRWASEYE